MMERYIAEKFIPQEFLNAQPEVENYVRKELSETLVMELLKKYEPGQLVMVQLPRQIPSTNNPPWAGTNIRMDLSAKECIQCKNCECWGGRPWYEATLDDHTRGTCSKNLRQEAIFAPPRYAVTFANDFCSSAKRRKDSPAGATI